MTKTDETTGQRAALFPVLSESSKEKRAVSILLACVEQVPELAKTLLEEGEGLNIGPRTTIRAWTETGAQGQKGAVRPDGRLEVTRGRGQKWAALLEAKIGNTDLDGEQIEQYLKHAQVVGADALITISNDFAVLPTHHPTYRRKPPKNVGLLHWSWSSVLTKCKLLIDMDKIEGRDHRWVVEHLIRFLEHSGTGVKRFEQMPTSWKDIMDSVDADKPISRSSQPALEATDAWIQECRDLSLQLSVRLGLPVPIKLTRAEQEDPKRFVGRIHDTLCRDERLEVEYKIPNSASPMRVQVDLRGRTLNSSMTVEAPQNQKKTKTRVNWLLRQLTPEKTSVAGVSIKAVYRRGQDEQEKLERLRDYPEALDKEDKSRCPNSFEVKLTANIGRRMVGPKTFIQDIESHVPEFYEQIGQHLRNWVPRAPTMEQLHDESDEVLQTENEEIAR